jgi:integrase
MFSAMRSEAARRVRWEHVDTEAQSLAVPNPKGGENKAFRVPLGPTLIELLERRRRENAAEFSPYGGDAGWVFPSLTRAKPYRVQPVAEAKERRVNRATGRREKYLSGPHVSRRTYLSVAKEAGISELDRSVLANHAFGSQSVNQTYIEQHFGHLLGCQAKIDAALLARMSVQDLAGAAPTAQLSTQASTSDFE